MPGRPPRRAVVAAAAVTLSLLAATGAAAGDPSQDADPVESAVAVDATVVDGDAGTLGTKPPRPPKDPVGGAEISPSPDTPTDSTTVLGAFVPGQVLVAYTSSSKLADQLALETTLGATRVGEVAALGVRILQVAVGAEDTSVATLTASRLVTYAERDGVVAGSLTPNDSFYASSQWALPRVNAPAAWDVTTGSTSTTVAVLDTGVLPTQPDLQGKLLTGYDWYNNDSDPLDDHGHGTSISGVIAAVTNNGDGVAALCWSCKVLPVKVLGSTMQGSWSAVANGMTWSVDRGARILNLSLAGGASTTFDNAMAYVKGKGGVVLAAAGNASSTSPTWPAAHPDAVGVGGTDQNDVRYSWSNYGSWVDVTAPGCTYTTRAGSYQSFCGTSAATPVVAGAVALLLSAKPALTNAEIIQALYATTTPSTGNATYGRIDAAKALQYVGATGTAPPPTEPPPPPPPPPPPASTVTTTFTGSSAGGSKAVTTNYNVPIGAGTLSASLQWSGSQPTLALKKGRTSYGSASTGNPVQLSASGLAAGTYTLSVTVKGSASWTLTVTHPPA